MAPTPIEQSGPRAILGDTATWGNTIISGKQSKFVLIGPPRISRRLNFLNPDAALVTTHHSIPDNRFARLTDYAAITIKHFPDGQCRMTASVDEAGENGLDAPPSNITLRHEPATLPDVLSKYAPYNAVAGYELSGVFYVLTEFGNGITASTATTDFLDRLSNDYQRYLHEDSEPVPDELSASREFWEGELRTDYVSRSLVSFQELLPFRVSGTLNGDNFLVQVKSGQSTPGGIRIDPFDQSLSASITIQPFANFEEEQYVVNFVAANVNDIQYLAMSVQQPNGIVSLTYIPLLVPTKHVHNGNIGLAVTHMPQTARLNPKQLKEMYQEFALNVPQILHTVG